MTKQEYMDHVRKELQGIPEKEKQEAIEYLKEYFLDAQESEDTVIENLGSPEKFAATIQADLAINMPPELPKQKQSSLKNGWTIIVGILALPLAIPTMILIFVAIVVIASLVLGAIVTLLALILASFVGLGTLFTTDFVFSSTRIGPVLMMAGIIIFSFCLICSIVVYGFPWLTRQLAKLYQNLKEKENEYA